jgi:hypothetical protein
MRDDSFLDGAKLRHVITIVIHNGSPLGRKIAESLSEHFVPNIFKEAIYLALLIVENNVIFLVRCFGFGSHFLIVTARVMMKAPAQYRLSAQERFIAHLMACMT